MNRNLIVELNRYTVKSPMLINASIIKDLKSSSPDFAQISIYNLSSETRTGVIEDDTKVRIYGGYGEQEDLIFTGDIQFITNHKSDTEWLTNITAGDGSIAMKQRLLDKTYASGVKLETIVRDAANAVIPGEPELLDIKFKNQPTRGVTITGNATENLREMAKSGGAYVSVQDDRVVVGSTEAKRKVIGYKINVNTGMVGVPEWMNTGQDNAQLKTLNGRRIRVRSLCIPSIKPYDRVQIKSDQIQFVEKGNATTLDHEFTVTRVEHSLNTREGDFQTTIEAIFNE